jgi:hypothetical protein
MRTLPNRFVNGTMVAGLHERKDASTVFDNGDPGLGLREVP